jgi:hypothetical protein
MSSSPKALSRQHSRDPSVHSVSPRFNGGPAPSPIGLLPASGENPLPPRIYRGIQMTSRSITQQPQIPTIPNLVRQNEWMNFQHQNMLRNAQDEFQRRTLMPPRLSPGSLAASILDPILDPFAPFRNHMRMESGTTMLYLDDGTSIDMGNDDIDRALTRLRRIKYSDGLVTYEVEGYPEIEMIILPNGHIILRPPSALTYNPPPRSPHGGTIARKMGRKGTNKRRRRHISKTRHRHRRRCMNHTRRK